MALCPNCRVEITRVNIVRENIDHEETARMNLTAIIAMRVETTMYSCPNCHTVLGIAQYMSV